MEGFDLGESGPQVAVFADPGCLPSRAAVASLARRALQGEIRLRVVPVGVIGEASRGDCRGNTRSRGPGSEPGSVLRGRSRGVEAVAGSRMALVGMNGRLLERSGTEYVPYSLKRNEDGSVSAVVGADFGEWFDG